MHNTSQGWDIIKSLERKKPQFKGKDMQTKQGKEIGRGAGERNETVA